MSRFTCWSGWCLDVQIWSEIWADIVKRPYITIGMTAFVMLVPLAMTSNNLAVRRARADWRALHRRPTSSQFWGRSTSSGCARGCRSSHSSIWASSWGCWGCGFCHVPGGSRVGRRPDRLRCEAPVVGSVSCRVGIGDGYREGRRFPRFFPRFRGESEWIPEAKSRKNQVEVAKTGIFSVGLSKTQSSTNEVLCANLMFFGQK